MGNQITQVSWESIYKMFGKKNMKNKIFVVHALNNIGTHAISMT